MFRDRDPEFNLPHPWGKRQPWEAVVPGSPKGQMAEGSAEKQLVYIRSNAFSLLYDDSVGEAVIFLLLLPLLFLILWIYWRQTKNMKLGK